MKKNRIYRLEDIEIKELALKDVRRLSIIFLSTYAYISIFFLLANDEKGTSIFLILPIFAYILIIRSYYKFKLKLYKGYSLELFEDCIKQVFEIDKISGMFGYGWTRQKTLYNSQEKYLYFARIEKLVFKKKGLLLVSKNGNSESLFIPKQITSFDDICVEIKNETNL